MNDVFVVIVLHGGLVENTQVRYTEEEAVLTAKYYAESANPDKDDIVIEKPGTTGEVSTRVWTWEPY